MLQLLALLCTLKQYYPMTVFAKPSIYVAVYITTHIMTLKLYNFNFKLQLRYVVTDLNLNGILHIATYIPYVLHCLNLHIEF